MKLYLPLKHGAYINLRNHRKLMIIDGKEAFTGGMNIRDNHMPSRFIGSNSIHDLHFHVKGPVVSDLQRAFQEDWFFVAGEKLPERDFFPRSDLKAVVSPAVSVTVRTGSSGN